MWSGYYTQEEMKQQGHYKPINEVQSSRNISI